MIFLVTQFISFCCPSTTQNPIFSELFTFKISHLQTLLCPPITSILSSIVDSSSLPFYFHISVLSNHLHLSSNVETFFSEWIRLILHLPSPLAIISAFIKQRLPIPRLQCNHTPHYSLVVSNV